MRIHWLGFCYAFFFFALLNYLHMIARLRCQKAFEKKQKKYKAFQSEEGKKTSDAGGSYSDVLKVVFLHPDLGLGGAERLVVDACNGLIGHQKHCRCEVVLVTTHHEPKRAFTETVNGTIPVVVWGDWLPRSICGRFVVFCTILRMLWAAFRITMSLSDADVIFVDQVPAALILLQKVAPHIPRFFYCHFPDQLCDGRRNEKGEYMKPPIAPVKAYRDFFDAMERQSMDAASAVYSNSQFSRETTLRVFPALKLPIENVLYPPVPPAMSKEAFDAALVTSQLPSSLLQQREGTNSKTMENLLPPSRPLFVSINRFERKKNIELAIEAFCMVYQKWKSAVTTKCSPSPILVLGGGYDLRLDENKNYNRELRELVSLRTRTIKEECREGETLQPPVDAHLAGKSSCINTDSTNSSSQKNEKNAVLEEGDVIFLHNVSAGDKAILFHQMTALLYTPLHEHFGIVPLEAMQVGKPVVAVSQCGPLESVGEAEKDETAGGLLVDPNSVEAFADAMLVLATDSSRRSQLGEAGRKRVQERFSMASFADRLIVALLNLRREALQENLSETKSE